MEIIVLDIEATGKNPKDMIVEIGLVKLDLDNGNIESIFDKVVKEDRPFKPDSWIFENSTLTPEMVKKAKLLKEFKSELQQIFNKFPVTCFCHKYDFSFLEYKDRGFKIDNKFWDPMIKLTPIMKLPPFKYGNYKWPKVQEAYNYLFPSENYIEKHRALDDALHEAKIIYKLHLRGDG